MGRTPALALGVALGVLCLGGAALAAVPATAPVVVELFGSEGCSSCPPADRLLSAIVRGGKPTTVSVIALSYQVDYWNRLGWADPWSRPEWTGRQYRYAAAMRRKNVYTPQAIVDGAEGVLGSAEGSLFDAVTAAARVPKALMSATPLGGATTAPGVLQPLRVAVSAMPAGAAAGDMELLDALVEDGLSAQVLRGENAGRKLAHDAVVRRLVSVGKLSGAALPRTVDIPAAPSPAGADPSRLRRILILQEPATMRIRGACVVGPSTPSAPSISYISPTPNRPPPNSLDNPVAARLTDR